MPVIVGARRLAADCDGTSLMEFALGLPLILAMGGYGVELSNLAITNLRISQAALQLADNSSRVGVSSGQVTTQLREGDINDVLQGTRLIGNGISLTTRGRVTLSSLENVQQSYDTAPVQRIHWQRCIGLRSDTGYGSSYGAPSTTAGSTATLANAGIAAPNGMGDSGAQVTAPSGAGVMFVEINYQYRPLFGSMFVSASKLHYVASFLVRDRRDYAQIYNPNPQATPSTCDKYTA